MNALVRCADQGAPGREGRFLCATFSAAELDELLAIADSPPVVNQVQFSPLKYRRTLLEACEQRGVALEA